MSINIGPAAEDDMRPRITVVGIGGAGGNAIANMIDSEIEGVEFIVANTDAQALSTSPAQTRIQLGPDITGGLGAGARPEVGKAAAEETVAEIEQALDGVNMVFIAAGMGGGTGTGAAPVIAEAARRKGVLTVGVVTKPFLFEGTRRMRAAEAGITELQSQVDTLIVIPNQNLFLIAKPETTFKEAFELADEVLQQGVRSITDLMVMPGLINLDFADVRSVMSEMGKAMMGTGEGEGESRALDAAEQAIANPLLDGVSMQGAKGVIISIIGGEDMKLMEVDEAANHIRDLVDEDANIIWGSAFNPDLSGKIRVSVVATGIEQGGSAEIRRSEHGSLADARPPKRPALDLSGAQKAPDQPVSDATTGDTGATGDEGERTGLRSVPSARAPKIPPLDQAEKADAGTSRADTADRDDEAVADDAASGSQAPRDEAEPFDLTGMQIGDDMGEESDDVEDIVDPLAGIRRDEDEDTDADGTAELRPGNGDAEKPASPGMKETAANNADTTGADKPADSARKPFNAVSNGVQSDKRKRGGILGSGLGSTTDLSETEQGASDTSGAPVPAPASNSASTNTSAPAAAPAAAPATGQDGVAPQKSAGAEGSTLFERMANLSRSPAGSEDGEDEDDDDSPALSIPRFLGRQNNQ